MGLRIVRPPERGNICFMRLSNRWPCHLPPAGRPTWAEISLPRLVKNFQAIQRRVGSRCEVMAVVKANAYGHGAAAVARALSTNGARWFGVATLEEGQELRRAGIRDHLLLLGTFFPDQAAAAIDDTIQVTASSRMHLNALEKSASRKKPAMVHLKFDTGMGRLGFSLHEAEGVARRWAKGAWPHLRLNGIFSHLASAEDLDSPQTVEQTERFGQVISIFEAQKIKVPLLHLANSGGSAFHPATRLKLVRAGIALYGYEPRQERLAPMGTAPALFLKTRVMHLKSVSRAAPLGYDATFVTRRPSVIATLPIGYADGVNRRLSFANQMPDALKNARSHPMCAIVRGQFAPIVGRVSMDLTILDVTDVRGVRLNDEVTLLGHSGSKTVTARDWAEHVGSISYEVLCGISARVHRVYKNSLNVW